MKIKKTLSYAACFLLMCFFVLIYIPNSSYAGLEYIVDTSWGVGGVWQTTGQYSTCAPYDVGLAGGFAVDSDGNMFVSDWFCQKVSKFDSRKRLITQWGRSSEDDSDDIRYYDTFRPWGPSHLVLSPVSSLVYVSDAYHGEVKSFFGYGQLTGLSAEFACWKPGDEACFDAEDNGQPYRMVADGSPGAIAVDPVNGDVYVAAGRGVWGEKNSATEIYKFDALGDHKTLWKRFSQNSTLYPLLHGESLGIDSNRNIYVAVEEDTAGLWIHKYHRDGALIKKWQTPAFATMAVDKWGNVYIGTHDWAENRNIIKYDSDGNFLTKWGKYGLSIGDLQNIDSITVDSKGVVYVTALYFGTTGLYRGRITAFKPVIKPSLPQIQLGPFLK